MTATTELIAIFDRERNVFVSDDGATRLIIGTVRDPKTDDQTTVRGEADEGDLQHNLLYRFWGQWRVHDKYGRQFAFENFTTEKPAGEVAVTTYLRQCNGIGLATARRMWEKFGEGAVDELRERPDRVAANIKGITAETARSAAWFLREEQGIERTKIELLGLLHGRGFRKKLPDWLLKDHGAGAAVAVRRNPYLVMQYTGSGFGKSDKLFLELGGNPARLKRQALCCWHAITIQSDGSTWYPAAVCRAALAKEISGGDVKFERAMSLAIRARLLAERHDNGVRWIAERRNSDAELEVAMRIAEAIGET